MRRISIFPAVFVMAVTLVFSGCDDDVLHGTMPIADNYYTGTTATNPQASDLLPIPDSDTIDIDFGLVDVGSLTYRYLFIPNDGNLDLAVINLAIDPATSLDYLIEGEKTVAAPGGYLVIKIAYVPDEVGTDTGSFVLTLNTTEHQIITVNITGEGVAGIQVCASDCTGDQQLQPCQGAGEICSTDDKDSIIVEFGEANMEERISRDIIIRNLGFRQMQISDVVIYGGSTFVFEVDKNNSVPGVLSPGDEMVVYAIYAPFYGGEHLSSLRIKSNDVNEPEVEVVLRGIGMAPRICPDPMVLDFGNVVTGTTATKNFTLTNCGLLEVDLYDVTMAAGSSQDFSLANLPALPTTLAVGQQVSVDVEYYPQSPGSDAGGAEIYSSDITSDPVTNLTGTVTLLGRSDPNVCDILATPFAVNFGSIEVGQAATADLVLSNVGNDSCVIDRLEITQNTPNAEFSLITAPPPGSSFDPGDILQVGLGYDPFDHGQDVGVLSVFGNDKDTNEVRIDLNAFGLYPDGEGPVAICSVDPTSTVPLTTVTWYGDQSYDTNNRPIVAHHWSIVSFPAGSAARLVGTGANRYTEVDLAGTYIAELIVENDLGQMSRPCRAATTVTPTEDLWIEMYWTFPGDDMDLHLLSPGGTPRTSGDCYFMNCTGFFPPDWGVNGYDGDDPHLDLDDIPGTGPENINISDPADGIYTVFVHDYPGSVNNTPNPVTVNIYIDGALVRTFNETLTTEDQDWYVCEIDWPSGTVTPL